jgi:hypothetical protein
MDDTASVPGGFSQQGSRREKTCEWVEGAQLTGDWEGTYVPTKVRSSRSLGVPDSSANHDDCALLRVGSSAHNHAHRATRRPARDVDGGEGTPPCIRATIHTGAVNRGAGFDLITCSTLYHIADSATLRVRSYAPSCTRLS